MVAVAIWLQMARLLMNLNELCWQLQSASTLKTGGELGAQKLHALVSAQLPRQLATSVMVQRPSIDSDGKGASRL